MKSKEKQSKLSGMIRDVFLVSVYPCRQSSVLVNLEYTFGILLGILFRWLGFGNAIKSNEGDGKEWKANKSKEKQLKAWKSNEKQ